MTNYKAMLIGIFFLALCACDKDEGMNNRAIPLEGAATQPQDLKVQLNSDRHSTYAPRPVADPRYDTANRNSKTTTDEQTQ